MKRFLPVSFILDKKNQRLAHPSYDDTHKLNRFRSIRFLSKAELRYSINEDNQINLPLMILEYQYIKFGQKVPHHQNNSFDRPYLSLDQDFPVQFILRYERKEKLSSFRLNIDRVVFPVILVLAFTIGFIRFLLKLRRRRTNTSNLNELAVDSCSEIYKYLTELLYLSASPLAIALLFIFLMHISSTSLVFLFQSDAKAKTIPLLQGHQNYLISLIFWAFILQVI